MLMAALPGCSKAAGVEADSPARRLHHIPPLAARGSGKQSKKNRGDTNKTKNKTSSELKKRGHPSTPSNSDDSEKPQRGQSNQEKSGDPKQTKGQAKECGSRKSRKCKTAQVTAEGPPAPSAKDQTGPTEPVLESLRWEGALEDPAAEAQRLEIYRENRRQRYLASRQIIMQNIRAGDASKPDRTHGAAATANIL